MINGINIAGEASYSAEGQSLTDLRLLNFVYGSNGSGKTTISRVIHDPGSYPSCSLAWANNLPLECLVYNVDFVERNFASSIPGIFTLGEENVETLARIDELKGQLGEISATIVNRRNTLQGVDGTGGKMGELASLRADIQRECWSAKGRHDAHFKGAFTGVRNSTSNFCDRMLEEWVSNTAALHTLDDLKARAAVVFAAELPLVPLLRDPDTNDLVAGEASEIMANKIVGSGDVDIAGLIDRLGNSDWVKAGLTFHQQSQPQCPFCQQEIGEELAARIRGYFDETYEHDIARIDLAAHSYEMAADRYMDGLEAIYVASPRYLDAEAFRSLIDRARARLQVNRQSFARKRSEPSAVVALENNSAVFAEIAETISAANAEAERHNAMISDLGNQRQVLTDEIWKFLVEESRALLDAYGRNKATRDAAVMGLNNQIAQLGSQHADIERSLRDLERGITSVQPTVTEINALLKSFGFLGFMLATAGEHDNLYEIQRLDGSNAARTLSEGERTFIAFLYFYHLIRGSQTTSGMTDDRVVIFDDPVSSLDSDVLFIISSLIKRIFELARSGQRIRQVFVLTHNIYFHKEVSFDPKRSATECRRDETFWIVKKKGDMSEVEGHASNPIKTSYELLWADVKDENRSRLTIQNTLRRILENYFKILGNLDKDDICERFEGRDKIICNSLFSWINDGSHNAHDDLYLAADEGAIDAYLDVFRRVFHETGHGAHYRMMMGIIAENDDDRGVPPSGEVEEVA